MRSALAFVLGLATAYVLLLMAEQRKPEPIAGGWREDEDGVQPADPRLVDLWREYLERDGGQVTPLHLRSTFGLPPL